MVVLVSWCLSSVLLLLAVGCRGPQREPSADDQKPLERRPFWETVEPDDRPAPWQK